MSERSAMVCKDLEAQFPHSGLHRQGRCNLAIRDGRERVGIQEEEAEAGTEEIDEQMKKRKVTHRQK
jgi:hypothetical protein